MAQPGESGGIKFFRGTDTDDGTYTTALVAAVTGSKLRVLSLVVTVLTTAGAVTLLGGSTGLLTHHLALGVPLVLGSNGIPVCETASGEALTASNAAGVDSFISGTYVEITA